MSLRNHIAIIILSLAISGCGQLDLHQHDWATVKTSTTSRDFKVEINGLPTTASTHKLVTFRVKITNLSENLQTLPTENEVLFTTFIKFVEDAPVGKFSSDLTANHETLSGDYCIVRNGYNSCPPSFDNCEPGESREYTLTWKPERDDLGTGALIIALPAPFPEIPLLPMTVTHHHPQVATRQRRP